MSRESNAKLNEAVSYEFEPTVDLVVPSLPPRRASLEFESSEVDEKIQIILSNSQLVSKRIFDLIFCSVALAVFIVPMAIIALAIRMDSKGPILYRQKRVGLGGQVFNILKFRSMFTDAEKSSGAVWATSTDSRRTRVGAFIRRTSLDELPQLFNVLKGEMSLVGPRPERPIFVNQLKHEVPEYLQRHCVPVGITGLAQINGYRGNTCIFKRVEFDLKYARSWSIRNDLKILFLTAFQGFLHKNAY